MQIEVRKRRRGGEQNVTVKLGMARRDLWIKLPKSETAPQHTIVIGELSDRGGLLRCGFVGGSPVWLR